ncbi:MAG: UDP-N-acetylglucosamine-1-phosphate transferase [Candidatus Altiarchaeales archaeon]|nr:MAG: UDP-N-acetylglucosamine-1-phosphate transferase [Candidatus Altiarchaeales archaeon]RLI93505.1 MAG: UDP-N-acetylglucosamine-1-phosphate transferase [Candidatus Altiarchaeales archaeon]HDO82248.1 UDP-N-acetylglucosamine-1-phosphate transferase [Candidatus Altiarchaeales archaeon]HEX54897.1 UDP-N-acetylglucosamine-1-phosphate transferase [Candidatus Altiarchaeales archaeon]
MEGIIPLIIITLVSFLVTLVYTPRFIRKATDKGIVAKDMYKKNVVVPTLGGLPILAGISASLIVAILIFDVEILQKLVIFYFISFLFAMFGLADDLFDVGRKSKIFIPFVLALPIIALNPETNLELYLVNIELGKYYLFIIAPVYIMVVANLINMHSGYNGLSCGLSYILTCFLIIRSYLEHDFDNLFYILPTFGALLAFLYFNTYPAKIFWANIGSLMTGSILGSFIVINKMEVFGFVILIPHIVNFLMYVVWKIKGLGEVKFGRVREDGTLEVPNPWTLKWTFPYYFRLTEHQTMWILYSLTLFSGILGLVLVPYS